MSYGRLIEACWNRDRWKPLETLDQSADLQSAAIRRRRRRRRWVRRLALTAALVVALLGLALLAHAHAPAHAPARARATPTPPRGGPPRMARGIHESGASSQCSQAKSVDGAAGTGEPGR